MKWLKFTSRQINSYRNQITDLTTSRRAIVNAYEIERQRIERDLHDGTQQYLVAAAMKLGEAEMMHRLGENETVGELLKQAHKAIEEALSSLRTIVRGIHPQVLHDEGLLAAIDEITANLPIDIEVICPHPLPDLAEGVIAVGYFFVCEALNNIAKYAASSHTTMVITAHENLRISIVDTGPGGAHFTPGGGLSGMKERLAAFGGWLELSSPQGGPTQIVASIPLLLFPGESSIVL